MYIYLNDENLLYIEDIFVSNSPYLNILRNNMNNIDYEDHEEYGRIYFIYEDWIVKEDMSNYIKLISLEPQDDVSAMLLDYMGHINTLQYPNDFWNVKIYDNILRENFYIYPWILENSHYGLEDITDMISLPRSQYVRNMLEEYDEHVFIAGGAALYIAGIIDDIRDVDIFLTNKNSYKNIFRQGDYVYILENCISFTTHAKTDHNTYEYSYGDRCSMQIILREYKTPSEIVHGFDVDCCGYLYHPYSNTLYRTLRSKYSTENKVNFFDPERSSPSYPIRLAKYFMRQFNIWMPFEDKIRFNTDQYNKYIRELITRANIIDEFNDNYYRERLYKSIRQPLTYRLTHEDIRLSDLLIDARYNVDSVNVFLLLYKQTGLQLGPYIKKHLSVYISDLIPKILPHDPVSIIYLMKYKNVFMSTMTPESDYETYAAVDKQMLFKDIKPNWKTINPMEQKLSGTFYPKPIEIDILEWYKQSPLISIL